MKKLTEYINHISEATKRIVDEANATGEPVQYDFNEITITAYPGDSAGRLEQWYIAESFRRGEEYRRTPEYRERERKRVEAEAERQRKSREALALAPPRLTLANGKEAEYEEFVTKNSDPYGAAAVRYADQWARLMEARLAAGESLEQCADPASHIADTEGITGFMHGCAVAMLARVWIHGEQLRRWHNLKTQIGSEGEAASASGGVLNPALLSVSR